mgnify:CR=1
GDTLWDGRRMSAVAWASEASDASEVSEGFVVVRRS